jgi:microcystin-dependent protein
MQNARVTNKRRSISAGRFWSLCLPAAAAIGFLPPTSFADILQTTVQPSMGLTYMICTDGSDPSNSSSLAPFTGEIAAFSSKNITDPGWVPCDGSSLPIAGNSALFNTIGTNYGGNGTTNFDVPDLIGRVAIGAGQGAGLTNRNLGDTPGSNQVSLSTAILPVADGGQGQPFNNMQASETVNYIIDEAGIFPSRSVATPQVSGTSSVPPLTTSQSLIASIVPFAGSVAPAGWAFCDGSIISKDAEPALFDLVGTTYGGDGITTFALPDLRGRAPVSVGAGQGVGLSPYVEGQSSGTETTTLLPNNVPVPPNPGVPYNNLQPTLGLNYMIALVGIFPTQGAVAGEDGASALTPDIGGTASPELGQIALTADNFAPLGWALCNGQALSINQNDALFALIGLTYGGNGTTTFDLPDLRGRIVVGTDGSTFTQGGLIGVENLSLSAQDVANLPEPSSIALLSGGVLFLRRQKRSIA